MKSIFTDEAVTPNTDELKNALGSTYAIWESLANYTNYLYPNAIQMWHYSGDKYGWSFRISDKKRVLIYLLPRDQFFKTAFVFGTKATDQILISVISDFIKNTLQESKPYAEGRGIRLDVRDAALTDDLKKLIAIKIAN